MPLLFAQNKVKAFQTAGMHRWKPVVLPRENEIAFKDHRNQVVYFIEDNRDLEWPLGTKIYLGLDWSNRCDAGIIKRLIDTKKFIKLEFEGNENEQPSQV